MRIIRLTQDQKDLFRLLLIDQRYLSYLALSTVLSGLLSLMFPIALEEIINLSTVQISPKEITATVSKWTIVYTLASVATFVRRFTSEKLCLKIITSLKSDFFQLLLQKKMKTFNEQHTGELTHQLNKEIDEIGTIITTELSAAARGTLFFLGGVLFVFLYCFNLVLFTLIPTLALAIAGSSFGKSLKKEVQVFSALEKQSNSYVQEKLMQIKTVKLFSGEEIEMKEFKKQLKKLKEQGIRVSRTRSRFFAVMEFLGENTVIWGLGFGVYLMQSDVSLNIGKLTAFSTYAVYAGMGYRLLATSISEIVKASSLYSNILKNKLDESDKEIVFEKCDADFEKAAIQLRAVSFTYPGRTGAVLNNVSMNIKPGEIWGIIGASGCGKSTLFHLLTNLYTPDTGEILLNGVDIKSKPAVWTRQFYSIVSQESLLFSTSILENLKYSKPDANENEVKTACARADALEFIEGLPDKFETQVGENGFNLSGGQRQRICIARALLKRPKVLLLDEATSGLDGNSESTIQSIIEREVKKRGFTVIIITHRVVTLKGLTDYVALMQDGEIVQVGSYQEIEKSNKFQALTR